MTHFDIRRSATLHSWRLAVALCAVVVCASASTNAAAQSPAAVSSADATGTDTQTTEGPIPRKNLLAIVKAGGLLMLPIGACSFLAMVFVFERAIALRRGRVIPKPFVKRFLHNLREGQMDRDEALNLCEENGSPVAVVFAHAVRKWGRPAVEVEQAVLDGGERAVNGLRRYVRIFNGVSTISPLLGLLGTVVGMIKAFNEIATSDAMGRPELLAAGISEALITTAAGLVVAIPALVAYLFFVGRIDRLIIEIDALGQDLVDLISAEGLAAQPRTTRAKRKEAA